MKLAVTIDGREIFFEEYLTVAEAAKLLCKPKVWVYRRIKEGKIKTVDFAGLALIALKELAKLPDTPIRAKNQIERWQETNYPATPLEIPTTRGQVKPEDFNIKDKINEN